MSGPAIMALGPFQFQAHGFGFESLRKSLGTRWAEIPVAGGMNPSQWTGGDGQIQSIEGVVFPAAFGGLATLRGLSQAAIDGRVLPLVSLGGGAQNIFGMWFIEAINEDHGFVDRFGVPHRDAYALDIKAYQGAGGGAFNPLSIVSFF